MAATRSCTCHARSRTVSFTSSLEQPPCWCGLTTHLCNDNRQEREDYVEAGREFISGVPLIFNAKFWKGRAKDVFHYCPELKSVVHLSNDNNDSYLYFLANYLVGPIVGHGTFSKARKGLRRDVLTCQWKPVALKVKKNFFVFYEDDVARAHSGLAICPFNSDLVVPGGTTWLSVVCSSFRGFNSVGLNYSCTARKNKSRGRRG